MPKLYEIVESIERLNIALEDGEIDDNLYIDTLESLDMDLEDKAEAIVRSMRNEDSLIASLESEINALKLKKDRAKIRNERRKQYLADCIKRTGKKKWSAGIWTVSIQKNGGLPPIAKEGDPSLLPEQYRKITYSPIKEDIKRALMNGEQIDGWELGEPGESLRIR